MVISPGDVYLVTSPGLYLYLYLYLYKISIYSNISWLVSLFISLFI